MKPNVGHVAALLTACLLGSSAGCQSVQVGGLDMLTSPLSRSFSAIKDAATVNTDQHPDLCQGPSAGERLRLERARNLAETGRHAEAEALLVDLKGQGPARFLDFSKRSRKTFLKKLDKDRFRRDLGSIPEAYHEVAKRLGILREAETTEFEGPKLVQ